MNAALGLIWIGKRWPTICFHNSSQNLGKDMKRTLQEDQVTFFVSSDFSKAYDCVPHSNLVSKLFLKFLYSNDF